jgi:nucleoredoxin
MSGEAAVSALISKVGLFDNSGAHRTLDGKTTVLFYFSAHWCPPCKSFTPQLAKFYSSHAESKSFEIVFVSSDSSEDEFASYFADMPWTSVKWGSMRSLKSCLEVAYGAVPGIPTLIAVDLASMRLLTRSARSFVARFPLCRVIWRLIVLCYVFLQRPCCGGISLGWEGGAGIWWFRGSLEVSIRALWPYFLRLASIQT